MNLKDYSILLRAVLFGILLLVISLLSAWTAAYFIEQIAPNLSTKIAVGLSLFVIWLVHGSTLRSVVRLDDNISFLWVVLGGIMTIIGGSILAHLVKKIIEHAADIQFPVLSTAEAEQKMFFLTGLAIFLSLFSAINLKVKSRFLGNLLELLLILATCFLFYCLLK